MSANVYIIAGPNGAGKTTFARTFLPMYANCTNFVNADLIAQGLSPLRPEAAALRAGRLVLQEIDRFRKESADFAFETTLSGKAHLKIIQGLKASGYRVHFFYLWLPGVELSLSRVAGRVMQGGHDVPEADVRRRHERSIQNFFRSYKSMADSWFLFDASGDSPRLIAFRVDDQPNILKPSLYEEIVSIYGQEDSPLGQSQP